MADITTDSTSRSPTKETLIDQLVDVVGEHVLDTVPPTDTPDTPITIPLPPADPADDGFIPCCITELPIPKALRGTNDSNVGAIMLGFEHACPRWAPGSVIKWVAMKEGFKSAADADYAAEHLNMACQKWNELSIGVTFEWVTNLADATFALWHGGSQGSALASAFFPNPHDLSMMLVYNPVFSMPTWKANMWKVFMHELGHVLGLRHEFALDINPSTGKMKEGFRAVQLGDRNSKSVMTYGSQPPEVQQSDVESIKAFYALQDGDMIGLTPVQDFLPM
ncbi:metallo-peptidase family m12 domain-containing protein [Sarocladium implicatum]|nr:metallo-peptidase family m12 domain-containing protein [Sarocladium implicatum]